MHDPDHALARQRADAVDRTVRSSFDTTTAKKFVGTCLVALLLLSSIACAIDRHRSGLPPGAQTVIDELTEEIAAGEFNQVYVNASDEWRATVSAEENERILARVRDTFGRVQSRAAVRAAERGDESGALADHTVSISYNTKFERGDAIESFTLVERQGQWRLARYAVNSNALKQ
jgi:hypothetical protein